MANKEFVEVYLAREKRMKEYHRLVKLEQEGNELTEDQENFMIDFLSDHVDELTK
jgi:hypothetical protein